MGGIRFAIAVVVMSGCAPIRPPPGNIPAGKGWSCGRKSSGGGLCLRDPADCATATKSEACTHSKSAYCFTYRANDDEMHCACRETLNECDKDADAVAIDARDVSMCGVFE